MLYLTRLCESANSVRLYKPTGRNTKTLMKNADALKNLRSDAPASLVVFLVAVPLCLGIALASGAPLISGLIAGIIGGIVVGSLSGSPLGVSGPAAGLAVIVLAAITDFNARYVADGVPYGFEIFLVALVLAGALQIGLGFLRAGIIAYYFPSSVIKGMLAGIGLIIFIKQIPHAFGYDTEPEGVLDFESPSGETAISAMQHAFESIRLGPTIITAVSLAILIGWQTKLITKNKVLSMIPGPLLAVLAGVGLQIAFQGNDQLQVIGNHLVSIPIADSFAGLAEFLAFPNLEGFSDPVVYKTAVVLAVVGSLETLLCVEAADKLDPLKRVTPTNRELKAQGVGNVLSGLIGGLPVTQVIVRSSANVQAGARTKTSAILHGILILIGVVVLPTALNLIPLATLAAILLIVGYKLAKPSLFVKMAKEGRGQFIPFLATVIGIVFTDLLIGIGIGLSIAIISLLFDNYRLPFDVEHPPDAPEDVRIVLAQQVTFLNKASIRRVLGAIPDGSIVSIDGTASTFVHSDVVEIIDDFKTAASERNIEVVLKGLDEHQKGAPTGGMSMEERIAKASDIPKSLERRS